MLKSELPMRTLAQNAFPAPLSRIMNSDTIDVRIPGIWHATEVVTADGPRLIAG